jgi:hypothetical protein
MKLLMVGLNRKQQLVLHHVSTDSPFVNFLYKKHYYYMWRYIWHMQKYFSGTEAVGYYR